MVKPLTLGFSSGPDLWIVRPRPEWAQHSAQSSALILPPIDVLIRSRRHHLDMAYTALDGAEFLLITLRVAGLLYGQIEFGCAHTYKSS